MLATLSMGMATFRTLMFLQIQHAIDHHLFLRGQPLRRLLHHEAHLLPAAEQMAGKILPPVQRSKPRESWVIKKTSGDRS